MTESLLVSLDLNNNSINVKKEFKKNISVETINLSIIFISVPRSFKALINLEFVNAGIKEKLAKNNAVAIEENANDADIMSVKLLKFAGAILHAIDPINETIPSVIANLFLFSLPFLISIYPFFYLQNFKLTF